MWRGLYSRNGATFATSPGCGESAEIAREAAERAAGKRDAAIVLRSWLGECLAAEKRKKDEPGGRPIGTTHCGLQGRRVAPGMRRKQTAYVVETSHKEDT
jgi:hypothetical protein